MSLLTTINESARPSANWEVLTSLVPRHSPVNRSAMKIYETHTSSTSGIMKYIEIRRQPKLHALFCVGNHHTFASSSRWVIWWSLYLTDPHKQTSRSPIMNILQRLPPRLAMTIWCLVWEVFFCEGLKSTWINLIYIYKSSEKNIHQTFKRTTFIKEKRTKQYKSNEFKWVK